MTKEKFTQHLLDEAAIRTGEQTALLQLLARELDVAPMESPYEYVKSVQAHFDGGKIAYSDEYYDVLGIERK